jgi:3'-phosphoadenosine 5'-phosphosulfate (PAPS) 3'-phosphatase
MGFEDYGRKGDRMTRRPATGTAERGPWAAEVTTAVEAATLAGAAIRDLYAPSAAATYRKADGSIVTDADLAADRLIRATISGAFPDDALLTEETADDPRRLTNPRCWIADPIDGTDQFVNRTGLFDVLIALVVAGRPVVGVACHPPSGTVYAAAAGQGAWIAGETARRAVRMTPAAAGGSLRLVTSIWFGSPEILPAVDRAGARLGAAPAATVTTNARPADLLRPDRPYDALVGLPRTGDRGYGKEWDFAAIDVIVREAGGVFSDVRGRPHAYNKPVVWNRGGILVASDPATHARLVAAIAPELPPGE